MPKNLTTIYLIRHGQSNGNAIYKITDEKNNQENPLSDLGRHQAKELAQQLKDINFDQIYSSHLARAKETAQIIAEIKSKSVTVAPNIHERVFGSNRAAFGKEERAKVEGATSRLSEDDVFNFRYSEDGETAGEAYIRFMDFLKKAVSENPGKTILVVNHGNNIRWLLIRKGWGSFKELAPGAMENCGFIILESDGQEFTIKETHGVNRKV